jgi:hypothetical protein
MTATDLVTLSLDPYASAMDTIQKEFQSYQAQLSEGGRLDFNHPDRRITRGILERVNAYANLQARIKQTLHKQVGIDAADFFTETVLSYVQAAFASNGVKGIGVCSERRLSAARKGTRPDISFWNDGVCFAVIECKTQMGWSRSTWERDFNNREIQINADVPNVYVAHVVLTSLNWPGFPPKHPNTGCKWITLSSGWPGSREGMEILHPIEPLLRHIVGLACA